MKHSDYKARIEKNPEYQKGKQELKWNFALGDAIIKARIRRGLTQAELAKLVGTKQANISRLEAAIGNPTLKFIGKVLDALGIRIEFDIPATTTSYGSIPTQSLLVPNWPTRDRTQITSNSTQSGGELQ